MLSPDVIELREFYATELGRSVSAMLTDHLGAWWPGATGDATLGVGYPTPFFGSAVKHGMLTAVLMPAAQGAAYWPVGQPNVTLLGHEYALPFADNAFNRVLLAHAVENSEHLRKLLREVWRCLTPGGRVIAIVPNRRGIWARSPRSPFAHGQPFTQRQLRGIFTDTEFTLLRSQGALHIPPLHARWLLRFAPFFERLSSVLFPMFGGVILLEAEKQIYAIRRDSVRVTVPRLYPQPAGVTVNRSG